MMRHLPLLTMDLRNSAPNFFMSHLVFSLSPPVNAFLSSLCGSHSFTMWVMLSSVLPHGRRGEGEGGAVQTTLNVHISHELTLTFS